VADWRRWLGLVLRRTVDDIGSLDLLVDLAAAAGAIVVAVGLGRGWLDGWVGVLLAVLLLGALGASLFVVSPYRVWRELDSRLGGPAIEVRLSLFQYGPHSHRARLRISNLDAVGHTYRVVVSAIDGADRNSPEPPFRAMWRSNVEDNALHARESDLVDLGALENFAEFSVRLSEEGHGPLLHRATVVDPVVAGLTFHLQATEAASGVRLWAGTLKVGPESEGDWPHIWLSSADGWDPVAPVEIEELPGRGFDVTPGA
jgi:hypothetical protein